MKNKMAALLAACMVFSLCVTGCGSAADTAAEPETPAEETSGQTPKEEPAK